MGVVHAPVRRVGAERGGAAEHHQALRPGVGSRGGQLTSTRYASATLGATWAAGWYGAQAADCIVALGLNRRAEGLPALVNTAGGTVA